MPSNSVRTPKAPQGWQPSRDQQERVSRDSRLQRLSRDELYLFFNPPKIEGASTPRKASGGQQKKQQPARGGGFVSGVLDRVRRGMGGN